MGKRVSHSFLDPMLTMPLKRMYGALQIPRAIPPEGIVGFGHLLAIVAAFGFAFSTQYWWAAIIAGLGVAGNHVADVLDGTHARATGQCRNGGELLDHFVDPLSFSYYLIGLAISCDQIALGTIGVVIIYATAVLTSIKAKLIGEFELARFGPTEFKTLLVIYAVVLGALGLTTRTNVSVMAYYCLSALLVIGVVQLVVNLYIAVVDVNAKGGKPDTTEWQLDDE